MAQASLNLQITAVKAESIFRGLAAIIANVLMIPFGYSRHQGERPHATGPAEHFMPAILMFCVVGSFAINNSLFDVGLMLAMGILGYFLEANGIPVAPIVLGMVLGPIIEQNFMVSMIKTNWDLPQFFSRPTAAVLGVLTLLVWVVPLYPLLRARLRPRVTG